MGYPGTNRINTCKQLLKYWNISTIQSINERNDANRAKQKYIQLGFKNPNPLHCRCIFYLRKFVPPRRSATTADASSLFSPATHHRRSAAVPAFSTCCRRCASSDENNSLPSSAHWGLGFVLLCFLTFWCR
ncbi:hypothetical protein DEO72_LG3g1848 [Vigna unguiculata]|uniref:Uncharacterized protein n=1 Tax=Vigna unguiculata TaxID=3917 RepID=A0A4D6LGN0_VIGUN|nr:hypothetical protein DEO72_LG3g1848 [Vigna unguiculata]